MKRAAWKKKQQQRAAAAAAGAGPAFSTVSQVIAFRNGELKVAPLPPIGGTVPLADGEVRIPSLLFLLNGRRRTEHKGTAKQSWPDKQAMQKLALPLIHERLLPQHGVARGLARGSGVTVAKLAADDGYKQPSSYSRNARKATKGIIRVRRQFDGTNRYEPALPETKEPRFSKGEYEYPRAHELAGSSETSDLVKEISAAPAEAQNWDYFWSTEGIYDPRFPGKPDNKRALTYYVSRGLLDIEDGRVAGVVEEPLYYAARGLGCHVGSVLRLLRPYLDEWHEYRLCACVKPAKGHPRRKPEPKCERCAGKGKVIKATHRGVGLLRLKRHRSRWDEAQKKWRPWDEAKSAWAAAYLQVIYLPGRLLDRRLLQHQTAVLQAAATTAWKFKAWSGLALRINAALIDEWTADGREHFLRGFLAERNRRWAAGGISAEAIDELLRLMGT